VRWVESVSDRLEGPNSTIPSCIQNEECHIPMLELEVISGSAVDIEEGAAVVRLALKREICIRRILEEWRRVVGVAIIVVLNFVVVINVDNR
jgi:hypothetical protein